MYLCTGIYLTVVMALTSVSVVLTVLILNLHFRRPSDTVVPSWIRRCLLRGDAGSRRGLSFRAANSSCVDEYVVDGDSQAMKTVPLRLTIENLARELHDELTVRRQSSLRSRRGPSVPTAGADTNSELASPSSKLTSAGDVPGGGVPDGGVPGGGVPGGGVPGGGGRNGITHTVTHQPKPTNGKALSGTSRKMGLDGRYGCIANDGCDVPLASGEDAETGSSGTNEEILEALKSVIGKYEREDLYEEVLYEWRRLAAIVDRFLFWVFLLGTIASTLLILVVAPATKML